MRSGADFLLQTQNADGGWGYRAGGMSYVEPTAAVMIALENSAVRTVGEVEGRARDFMLSLQHADGGWGIAAMDAESGWMTAWAVLALTRFPDARDAMARGAKWLIDTEGMRVNDEPSRAVIRQRLQIDSTLRGWPWQPGDAAWVHPTALSILALSAAGQRNEVRVHDAIVFLYDRVVAGGGWNVGNPEMLNKVVPATIQDTAVALLALHAAGVSADNDPVTMAVQFLLGALTRGKTPAEMAWGIYALRDTSIDLRDTVTRLNELQSMDGSWLGNPFITAIAILAQARRQT